MEDATAEDNMSDRVAHLPRASNATGHEVIVLHHGFLRVGQPDDLADVRYVPFSRGALPSCIYILAFPHKLVGAHGGGTYIRVLLLPLCATTQRSLDGH